VGCIAANPPWDTGSSLPGSASWLMGLHDGRGCGIPRGQCGRPGTFQCHIPACSHLSTGRSVSTGDWEQKRHGKCWSLRCGLLLSLPCPNHGPGPMTHPHPFPSETACGGVFSQTCFTLQPLHHPPGTAMTPEGCP
jgi:hypothetical protein